MSDKLTEQQLNWLRKHYYDGDWAYLATEFNKMFKTHRSADAVRISFNRYKGKDLSGSEVPFADFTRDAFGADKLNIKEGRYFVSGVMPLNNINGELRGHINQDAFLTIRQDVDAGHCDPVLLATIAHTVLGQKQPSYYDPTLKPWRDWMSTGVVFNKHLQALDMRINPQQPKPLTGLDGIKLDSSLLIAHPRQHLAFINQGNELLPYLQASTGVLNLGNTYQDNRIGRLAGHAHKTGGLIVELKGDRFFVRQVQFDKKGGYYDLGVYHVHGEENRQVRAEWLKVGDLHFGHHDEDLLRVLAEICAVLQPKRIILEDPFDGYSHSHHVKNMPDKVKRRDSSWGKSIQAEIDQAKTLLGRIEYMVPKDCQIIFTASNHNAFLKRYIDECRYMEDEVNFQIGHELQLLNLKEQNLWQTLVDPKKRYTWLAPSQDFILEKRQLGAHGHLGLNGQRGVNSKAFPKVADAHGHTPFIVDDHWRAGHWSNPRHGYNEGPSNWMPTVIAGYPGDHLQQIIAIKAPKDKRKYEWRG